MALPNDGLAFAIGDVVGRNLGGAIDGDNNPLCGRSWFPNGNPGRRLGGQDGGDAEPSTPPPLREVCHVLFPHGDSLHSLTYQRRSSGAHAAAWQRHSNVGFTGTVVGAFPVALYEEKTVTLSRATYSWLTLTALWNRKTHGEMLAKIG
jgi:hypothetical protein